MADTIFALASARGKAGVSVIRVSGPDAHVAGKALCRDLPAARQTAVRRLMDSRGEIIDEAMVLRFDEGASFTGEKTIEFQVHGSISIVSKVMSELSGMVGLRLAEAGEFSRRALENDRLDLAQIEGLGALIEAETEAQRRQAFRVFDGALTELVDRLRADIIRAAALVEASIDFADEDVPVDVVPEVSERVSGVIEVLKVEIEGVAVAERVRDGFEVAIVGAPNVGKSTLLNRLVGREAAITSEVAGTTRDVIEVRMDLRGLPVTFLDTAGLRETDDFVETIGIDRARNRAMQADLRVFLTVDGAPADIDLQQNEDLVVLAKSDLSGRDGVSGLTGEGVDSLLDRIGGILEERMSAGATATHDRHRSAMVSAMSALQEAAVGLNADVVIGEIVAEELRRAARALETLIGRVDVEGLLDEIFRSFCIGK